MTNPDPKPTTRRRPTPKPAYTGPFEALDTLWDDEDASAWGCPIGVELALKHRADETLTSQKLKQEAGVSS